MRALSSLSLAAILAFLSSAGAAPAPKAAKKTHLEALQQFHDLIGSWRGTGEPYGTREEKLKGFWQETIAWRWNFKKGDTTLKANFAKSKHFAKGELRYLPESDRFRLTLTTPGGEVQVFEGNYAKPRLTLERTDAKTKQVQRLVFTLLHFNRHLYRFEHRPADRGFFTQVYQVGATKQGVPFATVDEGPECVVSGGLGTTPVTYMGKTYYVCCSGCRDAFKEEPAKYVREYEARKKAKKKD
jgi:hypothetical protein